MPRSNHCRDACAVDPLAAFDGVEIVDEAAKKRAWDGGEEARELTFFELGEGALRNGVRIVCLCYFSTPNQRGRGAAYAAHEGRAKRPNGRIDPSLLSRRAFAPARAGPVDAGSI